MNGFLESNSSMKRKARELIWLKQKDIIALHSEPGHPLEIVWTMGKSMGHQLIGIFKPYKACTPELAEKASISKTAAPHSTV